MTLALLQQVVIIQCLAEFFKRQYLVVVLSIAVLRETFVPKLNKDIYYIALSRFIIKPTCFSNYEKASQLHQTSGF